MTCPEIAQVTDIVLHLLVNSPSVNGEVGALGEFETAPVAWVVLDLVMDYFLVRKKVSLI